MVALICLSLVLGDTEHVFVCPFGSPCAGPNVGLSHWRGGSQGGAPRKLTQMMEFSVREVGGSTLATTPEEGRGQLGGCGEV